jgi:hypothetical protein
MKTYMRVLLFFVLPLIAPMAPFFYPPALLLEALPGIAVAVVLFALLGVLLWQGRSLALSFSIFLQGFNVITRVMMFFSTAVTRSGSGQFTVDVPYIVLSVLSIALSLWILLRLDRVDVHAQMIT